MEKGQDVEEDIQLVSHPEKVVGLKDEKICLNFSISKHISTDINTFSTEVLISILLVLKRCREGHTVESSRKS